MTDRPLTDLKNIGKTIAGRLAEVGIHSVEDLRKIGPVGTHQLIQQQNPGETLPVCYYLYTFEGALTDQHWDKIGAARKQELKEQINS